MDPFDLIKNAFGPKATLPDADAIADATVLFRSVSTLITTISALQIIPLSDADRSSLRGKDPTDQHRVSRAAVLLLRRRPALAQRVGVDPDTLAAIADKDEVFDMLCSVLEHAAQLFADGLLQVRAALSQGSAHVMRCAHTLLEDEGTDPALAAKLRAYLGAVDLSLREHSDRREEAVLRRQRKQQAHPQAPLTGAE